MQSDVFEGLDLESILRPYADEQSLLEQQLAQAQALRTNNAEQRTTGLGAGLAGLGDIINAGVSQARQGTLLGEQKKLLGDKQASAVGYHQAAGVFPGMQPQQPMGEDPALQAILQALRTR